MAKALPKKIFVKVEEADGTSYLVADSEKYGLAEQGEKIQVGTYQLVEVEDVDLVLRTKRRR